MNLAATTRSTNFDVKVRLEMSRYELRSAGSSFGFFSSGRTIARFCDYVIHIALWFCLQRNSWELKCLFVACKNVKIINNDI